MGGERWGGGVEGLIQCGERGRMQSGLLDNDEISLFKGSLLYHLSPVKEATLSQTTSKQHRNNEKDNRREEEEEEEDGRGQERLGYHQRVCEVLASGS